MKKYRVTVTESRTIASGSSTLTETVVIVALDDVTSWEFKNGYLWLWGEDYQIFHKIADGQTVGVTDGG